ncbi:hypothetical protein [Seohaeicola zhoushanensis]|uniref:hypothetical protein n=1 Tax=Seohaeicola zhoushanensis TaxID=1569283 RepID=UPI00167ABFC6|nr:hypothetical protein [Seohaeicola zhoushanensis]
MKLKEIGPEASDEPDRDTLRWMVLDYRQFVGTKAAFNLEHVWWPGEFETKDEERDFYFNDFAVPDPYEEVLQRNDETVDRLAGALVEVQDLRSSRNTWRVLAVAAAVPYLVLWYLWRTAG